MLLQIMLQQKHLAPTVGSRKLKVLTQSTVTLERSVNHRRIVGTTDEQNARAFTVYAVEFRHQLRHDRSIPRRRVGASLSINFELVPEYEYRLAIRTVVFPCPTE